ncbi:MAG: GDP-mannose 4,6-dehydratase [Sulfurimonas sp.]|jgi:nucleoside-diphosphate-sugar epimerase|nr:GDP-mannose 4,6-dehydratase [Sulfurimonas sp.]
MKKKVLITGIDSFSGTHLSSYLQKLGYEVCGTSLFDSGAKKYRCDITNKADIIKVLMACEPDYLIHLSGISFPAHDKHEDFYKVNTIGTLNILDALIELNLNPTKILLASSATLYGNQGLEILDETLCVKPTNHYGASKYAMESLAANYFTKLNIIITRPFNYTGANQQEHFLIPKIVKHFKEKKRTIELGNLEISREFNDIDYVCEVYKRLLESSLSSEVFNIASNRGIKLLDVIDMMNELSGYKIEVKINQDFVRKGEIKNLTGSCEKLFKAIGEVEQKPFKQTLQEMLDA